MSFTQPPWFASATDARSAETRSGSVEDEGAAPLAEGETPLLLVSVLIVFGHFLQRLYQPLGLHDHLFQR